jgi:hypothetical protein
MTTMPDPGFSVTLFTPLQTSLMGRKRKLRFRVSLDDLDTPEISLKELADSHGVAEGPSDGE